jgi:lipoprotein-anchoring transpeptidase ErfK/SrfK
MARGRVMGRGKSRSSTRRKRAGEEDLTLLYWIAGVLFVTLVLLMIAYWEAPVIRGWFVAAPPPRDIPTTAPREPLPEQATKPKLTEEQLRMKKLREEAAKETQKLEERTFVAAADTAPGGTDTSMTPAGGPTNPPPIAPPTNAAPATNAASAATNAPATNAPTTNEAMPPVAPPLAQGTNAAPARAMAVDLPDGKLSTEQVAAYQVALERIHFSCGFVDGNQGMRTQRMLRAFQTSRGLPVTGVLDAATRAAIGEPGEPFLTYTVTQADVDAIMPKPATWIEKSKATRLGYNDIWELLAEKFHCTRAYLKALNKDVTQPVAGNEIIGPKVFPAAPIPKAASLRIYLGETSLEALDAQGHIIAFFPCSIAKDKNKRPHGMLTVKVVDPAPDYTFDPALFADAAAAEHITHKLRIPPGPRNPVGTTWVGLSLPGYGIHGTPEPEKISATQSHGCFRLANWNAEKVIRMVHVGTPVDVEP